MKRHTSFSFVFFCAISFVYTVRLSGQNNQPFFLTISPDARAGAMGESGVAGNCDANSIFWNGAKLSFAERKTGIAFSYKPWLRSLIPDANLSTVSAYYKPDSLSSFATSIRYFSEGNIVISNASGVLAQYKPNEFAFDLCYARKLSDVFSASLTGRYGRSDVYNGLYNYSPVNYWSVDAGLFYR
ncbi:MAG TPA: PorV/PorQ family protein, partial [Bacteroidia bacterium]|nr:PorV/PorQ family protein [Bacteroidia bacterium]